MTARPLEHSLQVGGVLYLDGSFGVERCVMDCAYYLSGSFVTQCEEVGKVIFTELVIIGKEPFDALVPFDRRLLGNRQRYLRHGLHFAAMFFPFLDCGFLLRGCHFGHRRLCKGAFADRLDDKHILKMVDLLDEFDGDLQIILGAEFKPL